jgi:hypothetical protein
MRNIADGEGEKLARTPQAVQAWQIYTEHGADDRGETSFDSTSCPSRKVTVTWIKHFIANLKYVSAHMLLREDNGLSQP